MWSKLKSSPLALGLLIGSLVLLVALAAGAVWFFGFHMPYIQAENTMDPNGTLTLWAQEDGSVLVQWPSGQNADRYTLEVALPTAEGTQVLFSQTVPQCECTVPNLQTEESLILRVTSGKAYGGSVRPGTAALEVKTPLQSPVVTQPEWSVDTQKQVLQLAAPMEAQDVCMVFVDQTDDEPLLLGQLEKGAITLSYGETGSFTMPEYSQNRQLLFQLTVTRPGFVFHGAVSHGLSLTREDFLGTGLQLSCEALDNNAYVLTWNETKGDHYEVQLSSDGKSWQTLASVARDAERTYTTDYLKPYAQLQLRVLAVGGQTLPGSEYAAEPAVVEISTGPRAVYSTVWPMMALEVYADTDKTTLLGKTKEGQTFCVLAEKDGFFAVRYKDAVGYIDSNYCMINLPEFMPGQCLYDITNSYSSLYMVHEYGIPQVSGTVIKGYEKIRLQDGSFVVPLLYPSAKKLVTAAQSAISQGYRIKIYDSYRPNVATKDIFDLAKGILGDPVPMETFSGKEVNDLNLVKLPPKEETGEEGTSQPWQGVMEGLTYEILMTDNGRWGLANFLAEGVSNHNRGVAMDMTLVDKNGYELPMQTSIHDLSWYSEAVRNNANAKLLRSIMTEAGFGGLGSEWWHYQDNDARDNLKPPALYWGVNLEGWVKDGRGWRYRLSGGAFVTSTSRTVDGVAYTFDADGYVSE